MKRPRHDEQEQASHTLSARMLEALVDRIDGLAWEETRTRSEVSRSSTSSAWHCAPCSPRPTNLPPNACETRARDSLGCLAPPDWREGVPIPVLEDYVSAADEAIAESPRVEIARQV